MGTVAYMSPEQVKAQPVDATVRPLLVRGRALRASGAASPLPSGDGGGDAERDPGGDASGVGECRSRDPAGGRRDRATVPGEASGGAIPGNARSGAGSRGGARGSHGVGLPPGGRGALPLPGAAVLHGEGRGGLLRAGAWRSRRSGTEAAGAASAGGDRAVGGGEDVVPARGRDPGAAGGVGGDRAARRVRRPCAASAQALTAELAGDARRCGSSWRFEDPRRPAIGSWSAWRRSPHAEALVVVDQFEELFTLNPPETQERFAALLARLASEADVHVALSLRDDFLSGAASSRRSPRS